MRRLGRGRRAAEAELLQLLEVEATQEHRPGAATVLSLTNLCGHDLVGLSLVRPLPPNEINENQNEPKRGRYSCMKFRRKRRANLPAHFRMATHGQQSPFR